MAKETQKLNSGAAGGGAETRIEIPARLPVLPLVDVVVFPQVAIPLSVGRKKSIHAVDHALGENRFLLLLTQKSATASDPMPDDLYRFGTVGVISRMLKLPDGSAKLIVQGAARARVKEFFDHGERFLEADVEFPQETVPPGGTDKVAAAALARTVRESLSRLAGLGAEINSEALVAANSVDDPGRLADLVASEVKFRLESAQQALETLDPMKRLDFVNRLLIAEAEILTVQRKIDATARGEIDKNQREYYLRQQMKAIQDELGDTGELAQEIETLRKKIGERGMPDDAKEEALRQLARLERMNPESAEATTARTYLEWMTELPWNVVTEDNLNIKKAKAILDADHYGLDEVKERILEYLSVHKLKNNPKGPILCFAGPPGVGKTSLGQSIARALSRKFVRISLGGVRDEAEIRGHRRTYVGALPGRIVQGIRQAGSINPVFMLDEVDKLGSGVHGDPSAALLEVLDPEQNHAFRDNYLGVPMDLRKVLFLTTANALHPIHAAFLDRMEVIELAGYTEEEKIEIAERYLIPKQIEESGLQKGQVEFSREAVRRLITEYTREAGVRNLERVVGSVCRKVARKAAEGALARKAAVLPGSLGRYLGIPKVHAETRAKSDSVGVATGLAVTMAGGSILFVEAAFVPGRGALTLTGQLGETMQESAKAALSYARAHAGKYKVDDKFFAEHDLHIHVPAGAIPKDGPSAGITMAAAIVSAAAKIPIRRDTAMTGEITLRGKVLPVGGVKEKLLAAKRAGVKTLVLSKENKPEVSEIKPHVKKGIAIIFAEDVSQVLRRVLAPRAKAKPKGKPPARAASKREIPPKAAPPSSAPSSGGGTGKRREREREAGV